ncbi:hypothetical protein [Arcobacter sp. LA11]|uniref:hypothetical protein n=1 Tax=Arcobacter sp. LA11 TaxID=1898176 RepID=UPI00093350A3|nr:hypothetical protein [Arcobacter sp. LA11]
MIVAVKTNSKKKLFIRIASLLAVVVMFVFYYFYMSNEFTSKQDTDANEKIQAINKNAKLEKSKKLERIIYREIETAVDLIDQRNILNVKIISNRALIVVDPDTNLDALKVRYGSMALIKKGIKDIKIAIDLKYIIESKYNEK